MTGQPPGQRRAFMQVRGQGGFSATGMLGQEQREGGAQQVDSGEERKQGHEVETKNVKQDELGGLAGPGGGPGIWQHLDTFC